jgi:hypothetical protein
METEPYYTEIAAQEKLKEIVAEEKERAEHEHKLLRGISFRLPSFIDGRSRIRHCKRLEFFIAAPKNQMIINPGDRVDGVEIKEVPHVPDPIVLWPIEDNFYLIVTAWGDEASDPLVVNHKMN